MAAIDIVYRMTAPLSHVCSAFIVCVDMYKKATRYHRNRYITTILVPVYMMLNFNARIFRSSVKAIFSCFGVLDPAILVTRIGARLTAFELLFLEVCECTRV